MIRCLHCGAETSNGLALCELCRRAVLTYLEFSAVHFRNLDDLVEHLPHSCPLVGIELDPRAKMLGEYLHPERACYVLGAEDHGLTPDARDRCHDLVQIEGPKPQSLNVSVAGSLVMHHRWMTARRTAAIR